MKLKLMREKTVKNGNRKGSMREKSMNEQKIIKGRRKGVEEEERKRKKVNN